MDNDVKIYLKNITLEVIIPEKHVWEFMAEFGEVFAYVADEGAKQIHQVIEYYNHPNGWHIKVEIHRNEEDLFMTFLRDFCRKRELTFRGQVIFVINFRGGVIRPLIFALKFNNKNKKNQNIAPDFLLSFF